MQSLLDSKPQRAAIYIRVSSQGQEDGYSLDTQEASCRAYADAHGYAVDDAHVYREVYSGVELWDRPQLTRLREAVRHHDVDVIVAHAIDRLSRDPVHLGVIISEADHAGVDVQFVTEPLDHSPEGELIRFVRGYAAKIEHEKIRERILRGRKARVQSGKLPGDHRPRYGYRWNADRTKYLEDPETAPVVRRMFALALAGTPIRRIGMILDAEQIPTPNGGRFWRAGVVHKALAAPMYAGLSVTMHGVTMPEDIAPALVDLDTFHAVRAQLERNQQESKRNNRHPELTLLRGGYIRCGYCGCAMHAHQGPYGLYYVCPGAVVGCPSQTTITVDAIDAAVWSRLYEAATHPERIAERLAHLQTSDTTEADLGAVDRALTELSRRHMRGTRALLEVDADTAAVITRELASLAERRHALQEERTQILDRRGQWQAARERLQDIEYWCAIAAENMADAPYERRRQALVAFDVKVTVYRTDHDARYVITADPEITSPSTTRRN